MTDRCNVRDRAEMDSTISGSDIVGERRPRGRRLWTYRTLSVVLCVFAGYMIVMPLAEMVFEASMPTVSGRVVEDMSFGEGVRVRSVKAFFVVWFLAVGASIGSFLNVAASRMPAGKTLLGSSRCPRCKTRITRWDNLPIIGWLLLRGRCQECRQPISPRYVLVEVFTGTIFVLFLYVELLSGNANVPFSTPHTYDGFVWIIFYPKWDVIGLYAYHMTMLCLLVVLSLIEWDKVRVPKNLLIAGLAIGGVFAAIWPEIQPVSWSMSRPEWLAFWPWLELVETSIIGASVGMCLGWLTRQGVRPVATTSGAQSRVDTAPVVAMAFVGLYLGWQAALSVALGTLSIRLIVFASAHVWRWPAQLPISGWILVSTMLHLCFWRTLSSWSLWPGPRSPLPVIGGAFTIAIAAAVVIRVLSPRYQMPRRGAQLLGEGKTS